MVMFQKTSALNFVENFRKYSKYIVNEPAAVKERIAVWGQKSFFVSKMSYSSNNLEKSYGFFMSCCFLKRRGRKAFCLGGCLCGI